MHNRFHKDNHAVPAFHSELIGLCECVADTHDATYLKIFGLSYGRDDPRHGMVVVR